MAAISVVLAGCGGSTKSPTRVVQSWGAALNAGDNQRAADLFALGATATIGDSFRVLATREQAVAFNAGLGFSVGNMKVAPEDGGVHATFTVCTRATRRCGTSRGSLFFRIRKGKIVQFSE